MAATVPKVGQTIEIHDGRQGVIRYIGGLHIAEGDWLGLELPEDSGKNDGSVKGERYFTCKPGHGIFVRKESSFRVVRQAAAVAAGSRVNGSSALSSTTGTRPRPSSGITPDIARKRQSLMSSGSATTNGSRLSVRSPTKSPNKPLQSTVGSTASTRTGTPAATNRTSDSSTKSKVSIASRPSSIASSATATRTASHASRPSIGGVAPKATRPTSLTSRTSLSAKRISAQTKPTSRQGAQESEAKAESRPTQDLKEQTASPVMDEEGPVNGDVEAEGPNEDEIHSTPRDRASSQGMSQVLTSRGSRTASISRSNGIGSVEARAAQVREIEQLKAKIRTLEKQRDDDGERLQLADSLQGENDRYKNIIQALQNKMKSNQQELLELRAKYADAEERANAAPEVSGEHESAMELATLDKEMAEERAELFKSELDALKLKHEEFELEIEVLREENRELSSVMTPEEKASAGWLQMERERERLRDALVMLRDMTQETESDLRTQIKELQDNLEEAETNGASFTETAEKLNRAEQTNRHLMEQLEAAETNDEVVEAMEVQREQHLNIIDQLKRQIQDFEEHIQVTDELEIFHVEEEKRLHAQLDDAEAVLSESNRQNVEQDRVIEDLEYTLTKFRDVVQGLQADIDELRRSREISELQANEMSSKSRAMMDLNLRLQSNAAKTQAKVIDSELERVKAELATKHVEILTLFTLESFEVEKSPVLALLCFGRLKAKANLVSRLLNERLRERLHLSQGEEIFRMFDIVEKMQWFANACERFESFMNTCTTQQFASCASVLYEIEPVERTISAWLDALRKDDLGSDSPAHFKRMQEVFIDLTEKLIEESPTTKATHLIAQSRMVESSTDNVAGQLNALLKVVQSKLGGPRDDDDESILFDKKMDQLATKARTTKYIAGKVVQQLDDRRESNLCLSETSWIVFEDTERNAANLAQHLRHVCTIIAEDIGKFEPEQPLSYSSIVDTMTAAWLDAQHAELNKADRPNSHEDVFGLLTARLSTLQSAVDDMSNKSSDLNSTIETQFNFAPWIARAKELKAQKTIAPEVQDEMARLERRNQELASRIAEREKRIEEMNMRVELAEKRMKDSRARDDKDKALQEEVERLRAEREEATKSMNDLRIALKSQAERSESDRLELDALRKATNGEPVPISGSVGLYDEGMMKQVDLEIDLLRSEILTLQAGIRFLQDENQSLRVPVSETMIDAVRNSWLDTMSLGNRSHATMTKDNRRIERIEREVKGVYSNLIDVASSLRPIRLSSTRKSLVQESAQDDIAELKTPLTATTTVSYWQPMSSTTRYQVRKQREEFEAWNAWRSDLVQRAKLSVSGARSNRVHQPPKLKHAGFPKDDGSNLVSIANNASGEKLEQQLPQGKLAGGEQGLTPRNGVLTAEG